MAWTTTKKFEYAAGNHKVQAWELTADSATLELDTGLSVVDHVAVAPVSMASSPFSVRKNVTSASVASNGAIALTGVTSGDDLYVTVWGH